MPIERILTFLGYDYHAPIRGRAEGVDNASLRRMLAPKQREQAKPAETAEPVTP